MLRFWNRLLNMENDRLAKVIFDLQYTKANVQKNWCYYVQEIFKDIGLGHTFQNREICDLKQCQQELTLIYEREWQTLVDKKPKLRLYRELKTVPGPERYVQLNIPSQQRSLLAQLRFGILPLHIETGRFVNLRAHERICQQCNNQDIEDEMHFLFSCELYQVEREKFLQTLHRDCPETVTMNHIKLLQYCFQNVTRKLARYVQRIFEKRKANIHSTN